MRENARELQKPSLDLESQREKKQKKMKERILLKKQQGE